MICSICTKCSSSKIINNKLVARGEVVVVNLGAVARGVGLDVQVDSRGSVGSRVPKSVVGNVRSAGGGI